MTRKYGRGRLPRRERNAHPRCTWLHGRPLLIGNPLPLDKYLLLLLLTTRKHTTTSTTALIINCVTSPTTAILGSRMSSGRHHGETTRIKPDRQGHATVDSFRKAAVNMYSPGDVGYVSFPVTRKACSHHGYTVPGSSFFRGGDCETVRVRETERRKILSTFIVRLGEQHVCVNGAMGSLVPCESTCIEAYTVFHPGRVPDQC